MGPEEVVPSDDGRDPGSTELVDTLRRCVCGVVLYILVDELALWFDLLEL